jgi:hypothetical protein
MTVSAEPGWAYLDPGSGSMLVAGLVGLLASLLFFLKGLYYRGRRSLLGFVGNTADLDRTRHRLVFYSEGRQYWNTFRPILTELASRKEACVYWTSDKDDPGLLYSSEFVDTKYIGSGAKAHAHLAVLEADVCAMTTPGLDVLQIKRSKGVKHYTHLIHAPTDVGTYKRYSFDYFDSILISGDHQSKSLRKLEALRGTKRKDLIKVGCLYYDEMQRQLNEFEPSSDAENQMTILVAPTWGVNGLLKKVGPRVLIPLLEKQWHVIVRPHPQSHISEPDMIESLRDSLKHHTNIEWDNDPDGTASMVRARALVSDQSGIVFDFAFMFNKPVITVRVPFSNAGLEAADIPWDLWELSVLDSIGRRIQEDEVDTLPQIIEQECQNTGITERARRLRDEAVANFACAAKPVADELLHIRDALQTTQVS